MQRRKLKQTKAHIRKDRVGERKWTRKQVEKKGETEGNPQKRAKLTFAEQCAKTPAKGHLAKLDHRQCFGKQPCVKHLQNPGFNML